MANDPYHTARQRHLGAMLDRLQGGGLLRWRWDYANSRAIFWVARPPGQPERKLLIRKAELLVQEVCDQQGIPWLPVPSPGGEVELAETLRRIEQLGGRDPVETVDVVQDDTAPITAAPVDLQAHPELANLLDEQPNDDRSKQVFRAALVCMEHGLSDGQTKWLLGRYPPFRDKYGTRSDADRQLDKVVRAARTRLVDRKTRRPAH